MARQTTQSMRKSCELVILRGLPGSGKTTCAMKHFPNHVYLSADTHMLDEKGVYEYDSSRASDVHFIIPRSIQNLASKGNNIVVANTFVNPW